MSNALINELIRYIGLQRTSQEMAAKSGSWLTSPYTVAAIQQYLGIRKSDEVAHNGTKEDADQNCNGGLLHHVNGSVKNGQLVGTTSKPSPTESHQRQVEYRIENRFWYWLFWAGALLGDEIFYFTFLPFGFFNVNTVMMRKVALAWALVMYVGQSSKEILKWPRPQSPPVVPLEPRYFKEYGMPSTHAMVGTLIPFSILYLTMDKVQYSVPLGFIAATAWMLLVCFSRLYRGMHYILDVIVGAVLTFALMGVLFPFLDRIDEYLIEDRQAPLVLSGVITFLSVTYPSQRGISSTREDTIVILSTTGTIYTSLWLNHHFQIHPGIYECALPDTIQWPSLAQCGAMFLREVVGVVTTVLAYVILRPIVLETISFVYSIEINPETRKWLSVEFPYKYVTYTLVGFACLLGSPYVFTFLGIDK